MDNLPIVLLVIAIAAVAAYFLFFRKKPLPGETEPKAKASPTAPALAERAKAAKAEKAPSERKQAQAPSPAEVSAEKLASADVMPVDSHREVPAEPEVVISPKNVAGFRKGLAATRGGFMARLKALFTGKKEIDPAILEQMEEVMLSSDVGVKTTQAILGRLREGMDKQELSDADAVWAALRAEATRILSPPRPRQKTTPKPLVVLMVGVNGVGKTTTIGKLATKAKDDGKKVLLAAGDTFRAAAVQQLEVWGKRASAEVVKGKDGGDPGAVAFEATKKAVDDGADLLLVDTAGRLHTKTPLMDEVKKVKRTIAKALDGAPHETLLVLDATTGQNALTQAAMFKDALDLSGLILTKLDGTAKGGVVLGVCDELKVPVRYVGLGERAEDLREFVAADFVEALFGQGDDEAAAA